MKKMITALALLLALAAVGCLSDNKAWVEVKKAELKSSPKAVQAAKPVKK